MKLTLSKMLTMSDTDTPQCRRKQLLQPAGSEDVLRLSAQTANGDKCVSFADIQGTPATECEMHCLSRLCLTSLAQAALIGQCCSRQA